MPKVTSSGWGPKLTGRMANYANAAKDTILLGTIQQHMLKEHSRPSTRRQDIIHPSEMAKTGWCPKATYLRIKAAREADNPYLKAPESIGVQLLNIFDEGHYIHAKWQSRLEAMGDLWGNWECMECEYVLKNSFYYDERCPSCKSHVGYTYAEVPLRAEQYLISGHADGAVPRLDALIEIKSVGVGTARIEAPDIYAANSEGQKIDLQGLWKDIKEPFPSHVRQGQLYLRLCDIMGLPYDKIIFLYESKFNQGAKEFVVKFDPNYCDDLLTQCYFIVGALNNTMSAPECPTGSSCKDCESYGAEKSSAERLGSTTTEIKSSGTESTSETLGRPARTSGRIIRPS